MPNESKELTPLDQKISTIGRWMNTPAFQNQLALAMPRGHDAPRFARLMLNEVRKNPKLAECTVESTLGVVMACAQTGLEPGPMGLAWVIPYGKEATFQIGYKGALALCYRSDQVAAVASEVVYGKDPVFEWDEGSDAYVRHRRKLGGDRGEPIAVYAAIKTIHGGTIVRVMSAEEIEKHRQQYSKDKRDKAAWVTAWDEMACKTVIKRAAKRAPVSTETQRAIALDDNAEMGRPQNLGITLTTEKPEAIWKCKKCAVRDEYPIPFDGVCKHCGTGLVIPADAEIDGETGEIIQIPAERGEG